MAEVVLLSGWLYPEGPRSPCGLAILTSALSPFCVSRSADELLMSCDQVNELMRKMPFENRRCSLVCREL